MGHWVYNLAIRLLEAVFALAALFVPKARLWIDGRRDWRTNYRRKMDSLKPGKTLWMHISSLGEFEQGRPVIERFREEFPEWRIVLSFFSPSGYEIRKEYPLADAVFYLPADNPANARDFLDIIRPDEAVFVKYDFWANYLFELKKRGVPTLLVSALFRPSQPFFRWYGALWQEMLNCFTHIFVQNDASAALLRGIGYQQVSVAGDTRVDRVLRIAAEVKVNPIVETFVGSAPVFVAGSSWEADENIFLSALQSREFQHYKLIVAPHEPSDRNVTRICNQAGNALRYSQFTAEAAHQSRVLVIDNIGLLNTLYRYGSVAYIGGGLGKGIHNTLEPAAFGLPVIFGPKYEKFEEARQFVSRGGAFVVHDAAELRAILHKLKDQTFYNTARQAVYNYLEESKGASELAMKWLKEQAENQLSKAR